MRRTYLSLAAIVTLCFSLLLISGCGSSGNKEGDGPVAAVGSTQCAQCHSATVDSLTGESIVTAYNRSTHSSAGQGCESCHGNGAQHQGKGPIPYPAPDAARCATCHDGTTAPKTTSTSYADSKHATGETHTTSTGSTYCSRCHTNEGAVLLGTQGFTGGDKTYTTTTANIPVLSRDPGAFVQITCTTCHEHGGGLRAFTSQTANGTAKDATSVAWDPNGNRKADQFDLCTGCHLLYTNDAVSIFGSGNAVTLGDGVSIETTKAFYHDTAWYRQISSTHYDNPKTGLQDGGATTNTMIEGYVIRKKGANPCFDCHGHEYKTGTRQDETPPQATSIWTDWAKSKHAGQLLTQKYAAAKNPDGSWKARSTAVVDAVMKAAATDTTGIAWTHYDWDKTLKADGTSDRGTCQRCHTATGASNYLAGPAAYDYKNNDFTHLSGWVKATSTAATVSSPQNELLYCWGCHSNAAAGVLRAPGAITADYNYNSALAAFPDVGQSNVCISCHSGMGSSGESISSTTALTDATITGGTKGPVTGHYLAAAGLMYMKNGFTAFAPSTTTVRDATYTYGTSYTMFYGTGSTPTGQISSTHRKLGTALINGDSHNAAFFVAGNLDSNGPCTTCHMQGTGQAKRSTSHTWKINGDAFDEVCVKCHDSEGTTTLTRNNFLAAFVEPQKEVYEDAILLAKTILKTNFKITYDPATYPYFFDDNLGAAVYANQVKNWTRTGVAGVTALSAADARKLMGACFNIALLDKEPGGFAHARTYTRRLLYDTVDFLDDKVNNNESVAASAIAALPAKYSKNATKAYTDSTLTVLAPGTSEAMTYLIAWSRSTGLWSSNERP